VHECNELHQPELVELAGLLSQARDLGVANVVEIAHREHAAAGLTYNDCLTYLRDHLHFYLGERELAGLQKFRKLHSQLTGTKPGPGFSSSEVRPKKPGAGLLPAKNEAAV
jgi:hypothetical protein